MELIWITSAKYLGEYLLELTFNNGEVRVFDGKEIIRKQPMFRCLQSVKAFSQFALDGWTVSWENGKIDLHPSICMNKVNNYEQTI